MKKLALTVILCSILTCAAVSCTDNNDTPLSSAEVTTAETTTEAITEPTTEKATKPTVEYYDGLICSENMTAKEKERSSFREFTLLDPEKCFSLSKNGRNFYAMPDSAELKVKKFTDDIREIKIYDEQLDTNFLVHVILPPDYDKNKEYPVFLMTDPAYWFKFIPELRQLISDGETDPLIFVTLGYDYDRNGAGEEERFDKFIVHQKEFLDFITNDLIQTVDVNYKVDESRSVFFGHSWGGLFSDYALFHSDDYDKQPFSNYIIGSAALWMYEKPEFWNEYIPEGYDESIITEHTACNRDYDYFERNETMNKNVFICAGGREGTSNIFAENGESLLNDAQALYERLQAHNVNAELKIYEDCYHNNYVEDMLKDYLKQNFPPNDIT